MILIASGLTRWKQGLLLAGCFGLGFILASSGGGRRQAARPVSSVPAVLPVPQPAVNSQARLYRLERDSELSRRQETLSRLLDSPEIKEDLRAEAGRELWRLTKVEAAEHEAEAALALQGWPEASVTVLGETAAVVIRGGGLTESEAASIGALVAAITGVSEAKVRITEEVL